MKFDENSNFIKFHQISSDFIRFQTMLTEPISEKNENTPKKNRTANFRKKIHVHQKKLKSEVCEQKKIISKIYNSSLVF